MAFSNGQGRRWAVMVGAALCVAMAAGSARAAEPAGKATEAIRKANDRLRELIAKPGADQPARDKVNRQITDELKGLLDITLLAERALSKHWETMTEAQRTDMVGVLREIIEKNYLSQLHGGVDYRTDYLGEEPKDGDVTVKTAIRTEKNGRPTKILVDYRLRPEGAGWRVWDVITEEVSILQNYRGQFNRIIAKDGVDGLIAKMRAKLEKAEKGEMAAKETKETKAAKE